MNLIFLILSFAVLNQDQIFNAVTNKPLSIAAIDKSLVRIEKLQDNPRIQSTILKFTSPIEKQFGQDAKEFTTVMIQVKNGNYVNVHKYLSSPEFVAYALYKIRNNPNANAPEIHNMLDTANDKLALTGRITEAMATLNKMYTIKSPEALNAKFTPETIALLLQSPYSVEYTLKKLHSIDKKIPPNQRSEFGKSVHALQSQFKDAEAKFDISNPNEINRARVLAKQRQIWKHDLYGHDGIFILASIAFVAYAGIIGEVAIVVLGTVLATFSALKLMINNGLNWKRMQQYLGEQMINSDKTKLDSAFESFRHSEFVKVIAEHKINQEQAKTFLNEKIEQIKKDPMTPEMRNFLESETPQAKSARSEISDIIIQQGMVERVVNDPKVDPESKRTFYFVADAIGALQRLKANGDRGQPMTSGDRVILSHPNVIDTASKLISQQINEKKHALKDLKPKDQPTEASLTKDIALLETQKTDLRKEAGITATGHFFKIAAPFIATVVIALKVSIGVFFLYEIFHLSSVVMAFKSVALMTGTLYGAFLVSNILAVTVYKVYPSLKARFEKNKPDYSDPKYVTEALVRGMMLDRNHGTSIIQSANRAILHPKKTMTRIGETVRHPLDAAARTGASLKEGTRQLGKGTSRFFQDKWSRLRGNGPVYSKQEQQIRDLIKEIGTKQINIEGARERLITTHKYTPDQVNEFVRLLSNEHISAPKQQGMESARVRAV